MLAPWKKGYDKPRQHIKQYRHHFADKGPSSQSYGFCSSHVWMWELDYKEGWAPNWCFWIVVLGKTLESPLDSKEIKRVSPKGNQPCIFIWRTGLKLKLQQFGHLMRRADSLERAWCWERLRGRGEGGEMAGWHHWLNEPEFEQILGDSWDSSLACCSSWGHKKSDTT